jgi:hypothetical protein
MGGVRAAWGQVRVSGSSGTGGCQGLSEVTTAAARGLPGSVAWGPLRVSGSSSAEGYHNEQQQRHFGGLSRVNGTGGCQS